MSYYQIVFVLYQCLGDRSIIGLPVKPIPDAARPIAAGLGACHPVVSIENLPYESAILRIKTLGPSANPQLRYCEGLRCKDIPLEWRQNLVIDGQGG